MARLSVHAALALIGLALAMLVAGFVLWQLGWMYWAGWIYRWAGLGLWLAFTVLALLAVSSLVMSLIRDLRAYLDAEARAVRRLLTLRLSAIDRHRNVAERTRQLRFWTERKRKRVLSRDNRRQVRDLFNAIDAELDASQHQLPTARYRDLRKALRRHWKQCDAEAMLALRQHLPCR